MTVVNVEKDLENLTLTMVAEFSAPVERVWQVWEDPRQLERWWGPPTWPATFATYEFEVGGKARYFMTGPDGTTAGGWWTITAIDPPHRFEFDDGFAGDDGEPVDLEDKTSSVVTLESHNGGTKMTFIGTFKDSEQLQKMVAMGMVEGLTAAMGQIDALLTA